MATTVPADRSDLTCARCGRPMARGPRSRPQGQAVCHPCRRAARADASPARLASPRFGDPAFTRTCSGCKRPFHPERQQQRFCSHECLRARMQLPPPARRRASGTTSQRGYGAEHQRLRRQWAPLVAAGNVRCARCGELIRPGTSWDLGHDDHDRRRYHGPEHASCNRRAGGIKGNRSPRRSGRPSTDDASPLRW